MKALLSRRQARRAEKSFTAFARSAKAAEAGVGQMLREMRGAGYGWLKAIEALDPAEAARLPAGTKEACERIIGRSADAELAVGDTLAAVSAVHESLQSLQ